jgi:hypothetical protein
MRIQMCNILSRCNEISISAREKTLHLFIINDLQNIMMTSLEVIRLGIQGIPVVSATFISLWFFSLPSSEELIRNRKPKGTNHA